MPDKPNLIPMLEENYLLHENYVILVCSFQFFYSCYIYVISETPSLNSENSYNVESFNTKCLHNNKFTVPVYHVIISTSLTELILSKIQIHSI